MEMKRTTTQHTGSEKELQSKKMLRTMIGSFLRKVKEKKNEKMRSFKSRLKTTGNPIVPQIGVLTPPTGTCHVAMTYGAPPLCIYYDVKSQELLIVQKPFIFYGRHDMSR